MSYTSILLYLKVQYATANVHIIIYYLCIITKNEHMYNSNCPVNHTLIYYTFMIQSLIISRTW